MSIVASPESMQPSPEISALLKENTDLRARVAELEAYRRQHGSAAQAVGFGEAGRECMGEDECIAAGVCFADYERGVSDAIEACERIALSRRPAAAAEELAPQDVSVLRRWAEQIERMASVFNDERSLLCQQAAILLHRIAYRPAEVAAEQPAAAGSALTDSAIIGVGATTGVFAPIPNVIAFGRSIEQHLRAAPQAAQGEGLTIDTPQFRVLVSSVAWESRTAPSDAFEAALNRLIAHIDQTIAAHTRASDGEDAERLDFAMRNVSGSGWACAGVFYEDGCDREAIDAAMQQAASNQQEGAK